jgi:hypothetical protein
MTTELTFKQDGSRLSIETTAKGMLAKLAHDLTIVSRDFSCTATLTDAGADVTLRVPVRGLQVDGVRKRGTVDRGVLSSSDRSDIERKIREEVLTSSEVVVTASVTDVPSEGTRTSSAGATVEVGGKKAKAKLTATITAKPEGITANGRATVSLDSLAIPPVKGPLGAFRVDDAIEVVFDLAFSRP